MSLSPPAHILRVDDDILECIIGDVVASDGVRPHAAVHLSHVCRRLRRIILARASFWTNLEIGDETHPELVHLVLERSHTLPLKITVSYIEFGCEIVENDPRAIGSELLDVLHCATPRFAMSQTIKMAHLDSVALAGFQERLATALGPDQPAAQMLDLCAVPCDPLLELFGPRLAHLELLNVRDFSLQWLHSVLQLASNLVVLILDSPKFKKAAEGGRWSPEPFKVPPLRQLHVLDINIFQQDDWSEVVELVQRHYPSILSTGQVVLLKSYDSYEGFSLSKLDLQRRAPAAVCLEISNGYFYQVRYPRSRTTLQESTSNREYAVYSSNYSPSEFVRGFYCWPESLQHDGPYLNAVRHIASTIHTLKLDHICLISEIHEIVTLSSSIARISWPFLHHLSLSIILHPVGDNRHGGVHRDEDLPANIISHPQQRPRTNLQHLSALEIFIEANMSDDRKAFPGLSLDGFPECLLACHMALLGFEIPDSVLLSASVDIDCTKASEGFSQRLIDDLRAIEGMFVTPGP